QSITMNRKKANGMTNGLGGRTNGMTNGLGGRTNGLTNGLGGRTNGLTNGLGGRTNGLTNGLGGRTNGMTYGLGGRTNGMTNGLTNGLGGIPILRSRRLDENAISPSRISLVLIVTIILLVPIIFLIMSNTNQTVSGLRVDGDFSDWEEVAMTVDPNQCAIASLDIVDYAVGLNSADSIFIYASTRENWMTGSVVDSLYVFIDADDNRGTGYSVEGMGADYAVDVYGWSGAIKGKQMGVFSGQDQNNWSAWNWRGAYAAISLNHMEIGLPRTSILLPSAHSFLFMTKRGDTVAEICDAKIALDRGALVVRQIPGNINGIISANKVMGLEFTAFGSPVDVTSVDFSYSGVGSVTVSGLPVIVPAGTTVTLDVTAPITGLANGTFVDIGVSIVTSTGVSSTLGHRMTAYANGPPAAISIDGAFGDWNFIAKSNDFDLTTNPNIDIDKFAAVNSVTQAFFYLKVNDAGEMLGGSIIPAVRTTPAESVEPVEPVEPGTPSSPAPLKKVSGEDITRIYIDTGIGGQNINGISANGLIEIKGQGGKITSQKLYSLPGKTFIANVNAANLDRELEVGVALNLIGNNSSMQYFIESTDWRNDVDRTDVASTVNVVTGTRGTGPEPPELFAGTLSYISAPTLSNTITINGAIGSGEWDNANLYDGSNFDIYVLQDGTNLYVAVVVSADVAANADDYCALFFDTDHGAEALPQVEDRQFNATGPDGSVTVEDYDGDNTAVWDSTYVAPPWNAQGAIDGGKIVYEFSIPVTEVWGSSPIAGDRAGFAIDIYDADGTPTHYYWGGASVSTTDLATWGDIVYVPEFSTFAVPIIICCTIPFIAIRIKRRPRHG
ncbi:MAG: hypothetical protein KKD98_02640, partial [Candidatus Thermoplasmatota archaeon]|nr:hypothetical protein [Candidatus Thermoplasmatota archaeon]